MNEMDKNKMIDTVLFASTTASLYEMLAEEASELSTAASKYARYLRDDQPVSEKLDPVEAFENLKEEIADVLLCIGATVCDFYDEYDENTRAAYLNIRAKRGIEKIYKQKKTRWANRLKEKEEGK